MSFLALNLVRRAIKSRTAKGIVSFGVADSVSRGCNWLTLIFLAATILPVEYGKAMLFVSIEAVLTNVLLFGQDKAILRFAAEPFRKSVIPTLAFVWLLALLLVGISGTLAYRGEDIGIRETLGLLLLVFLNLQMRITLAFTRMHENATLFAKVRLGYQGLKALGVLGFAYFDCGWGSYLLGALLAHVVVLPISVKVLNQNASLKPSVRTALLLVSFGWPFLLHTISGAILDFIDRFMLQHHDGAQAVGIYTFAYAIGSGVSFIASFFSIYMEPRIYRSDADDRSREYSLSVFQHGCLAGQAAAGFLLLVGLLTVNSSVVKENYNAAMPLVPIILLAHILLPIYLTASFRLIVQRRNGWIAVGTSLAACVNVIINLMLIPILGPLGAALATFVAHLALCAAVSVAAIRRMSRSSVVVCILFCLAVVVDRIEIYLVVLLSCGLFAMFLLGREVARVGVNASQKSRILAD